MLWAREGQTLPQHISEMLNFYGKCFLKSGYVQKVSRRLKIDCDIFNFGIIDAILFHDVGKIIFHKSLHEPVSPSSFPHHEIMSSLLLHLVSDKYKLKRNYDLHRFNINDLIALSVHTTILAHHTPMGEERIIGSHNLDEVYKRYRNGNIKEKIFEAITFMLEETMNNVEDGFPEFKIHINTIINNVHSQNTINNTDFSIYKQIFEDHLQRIYLLSEAKPLHVKASIIATRYLKLLMLADNFSACKGEVKSKKYFLDFDLSCIVS